MEIIALVKDVIGIKYQITYLHDPIMHGSLAGLSGGILETIYGVIVKSMQLTGKTFVDYGAVLVLGQLKPEGFWIGTIAHLINATCWGIAFSFIMKFGRKKYYVVKGIGFGMFIWLLFTGLATYYHMPEFKVIENNDAFALLGGGSIYGLIMSLVYKYLDQKMLRNPSSLEGFS